MQTCRIYIDIPVPGSRNSATIDEVTDDGAANDVVVNGSVGVVVTENRIPLDEIPAAVAIITAIAQVTIFLSQNRGISQEPAVVVRNRTGQGREND